jgi:hypothetical protein
VKRRRVYEEEIIMTVDELKRAAGMAMASMKTQIEELHQCDPDA